MMLWGRPLLQQASDYQHSPWPSDFTMGFPKAALSQSGTWFLGGPRDDCQRCTDVTLNRSWENDSLFSNLFCSSGDIPGTVPVGRWHTSTHCDISADTKEGASSLGPPVSGGTLLPLYSFLLVNFTLCRAAPAFRFWSIASFPLKTEIYFTKKGATFEKI